MISPTDSSMSNSQGIPNSDASINMVNMGPGQQNFDSSALLRDRFRGHKRTRSRSLNGLDELISGGNANVVNHNGVMNMHHHPHHMMTNQAGIPTSIGGATTAISTPVTAHIFPGNITPSNANFPYVNSPANLNMMNQMAVGTPMVPHPLNMSMGNMSMGNLSVMGYNSNNNNNNASMRAFGSIDSSSPADISQDNSIIQSTPTNSSNKKKNPGVNISNNLKSKLLDSVDQTRLRNNSVHSNSAASPKPDSINKTKLAQQQQQQQQQQQLSINTVEAQRSFNKSINAGMEHPQSAIPPQNLAPHGIDQHIPFAASAPASQTSFQEELQKQYQMQLHQIQQQQQQQQQHQIETQLRVHQQNANAQAIQAQVQAQAAQLRAQLQGNPGIQANAMMAPELKMKLMEQQQLQQQQIQLQHQQQQQQQQQLQRQMMIQNGMLGSLGIEQPMGAQMTRQFPFQTQGMTDNAQKLQEYVMKQQQNQPPQFQRSTSTVMLGNSPTSSTISADSVPPNPFGNDENIDRTTGVDTDMDLVAAVNEEFLRNSVNNINKNDNNGISNGTDSHNNSSSDSININFPNDSSKDYDESMLINSLNTVSVNDYSSSSSSLNIDTPIVNTPQFPLQHQQKSQTSTPGSITTPNSTYARLNHSNNSLTGNPNFNGNAPNFSVNPSRMSSAKRKNMGFYKGKVETDFKITFYNPSNKKPSSS
ncbi:unnamed protein product [[Candida] boidinii]|uniref:Unnamed protein product n=1 Tax=Candida boidinii TaxID=5477 RepID=A0ACB5TUF5_CANBO|nr:unnamed protein product [[Candida] boidinii]